MAAGYPITEKCWLNSKSSTDLTSQRGYVMSIRKRNHVFVMVFDGDSNPRWRRTWQCVLVLSVALTGTSALFAAPPALEIVSVDQRNETGDEVRQPVKECPETVVAGREVQ